MNVGLPGTGLAGLCYLLAALWMPCRELGRTLRGERDPARWRAAVTQASLALGIIAAIAATAWAIGLLLAARGGTGVAVSRADDGGTAAGTTTAQAVRILGVAPTVVAFATLTVVVLLLEVVGLVVARRRGQAISTR